MSAPQSPRPRPSADDVDERLVTREQTVPPGQQIAFRCGIPSRPAGRMPVRLKNLLCLALAIDEIEPTLHDDETGLANDEGFYLAGVE